MAKSLVVVESPAKAKTINKFLGSNYQVKFSRGHIMDLPKERIGVEVEDNFKPEYVIIERQKKVIAELKKEGENSKNIYLAPDPDREGEAISYHLWQVFGKHKKVYRVIFNEITKEAIQNAFKNPGDIDLNKVNAQQARRILDRIVGYKLSPLLWQKVAKGLSAGRVQSVALKLICVREKEIASFITQEYWSIKVKLRSSEGDFLAKLEKINDKKCALKAEKEVEGVIAELKKKNFVVSKITEKKKKKNPTPPFITSSLQQEAVNRFHFTAKRIMRIAQELYEGIDIGKEERVGLITYMRTDSVRISGGALQEVRDYIGTKFGKDFLPLHVNRYKSKKGAQEAHEAIRPTSVNREPDKIKEFLSPDQYKLYKLIWDKFVSSQMVPSLLAITSIDIKAGNYLFRASSSQVKFLGFAILFPFKKEKEILLPKLFKGEKLKMLAFIPEQHFTEPPPRYTESSLIKTLEEKGIGRPSTYAPIIDTIQLRGYVRWQEGKFYPSEMGEIVTHLLTQYFPKILDVGFTAQLENELDSVEQGKENWVKVLQDFYEPFIQDLGQAYHKMKNVRKEVVLTSQICEKCGRKMVIRRNAKGKFLACSGYPECKNVKSISTGVKCPEERCNGELVERWSKKNRFFYGCSNYPQCKFTTRVLKKIEQRQNEGLS